MSRTHTYRASIAWSGATTSYTGYSRDHTISAPGKPDIPGSADPAFRGDPARWNPEELLLAGVAACHKLWYLHLCADAGIVVTDYRDDATGEMVEDAKRGGWFTGITLRPVVTISAGDPALALALHEAAHAQCYLANSVNFPVLCDAEIKVSK